LAIRGRLPKSPISKGLKTEIGDLGKRPRIAKAERIE